MRYVKNKIGENTFPGPISQQLPERIRSDPDTQNMFFLKYIITFQ
jgi:hypothetical protein